MLQRTFRVQSPKTAWLLIKSESENSSFRLAVHDRISTRLPSQPRKQLYQTRSILASLSRGTDEVTSQHNSSTTLQGVVELEKDPNCVREDEGGIVESRRPPYLDS
jgi:hypothetical protein